MRSPAWQRPTISALNSGMNDRRGRGLLFATVSILDILSGSRNHLVDVCQTVLTHRDCPKQCGATPYVRLETRG